MRERCERMDLPLRGVAQSLTVILRVQHMQDPVPWSVDVTTLKEA